MQSTLSYFWLLIENQNCRRRRESQDEIFWCQTFAFRFWCKLRSKEAWLFLKKCYEKKMVDNLNKERNLLTYNLVDLTEIKQIVYQNCFQFKKRNYWCLFHAFLFFVNIWFNLENSCSFKSPLVFFFLQCCCFLTFGVRCFWLKHF